MAKVEYTYTLNKVRCTKATKAAILCARNGKTFWVPQSVVHDDSEVYKEGDEGKLVVQLWFAEKEGWSSRDEDEPEPMDAVDGLKAINRKFGR
jgi:hypothetical protein